MNKITIDEVKKNTNLLNDFVEQNIGLVHNVVRRDFKNVYDKEEYSDFVQIGSIGLLRAVKDFDYEKGFKFSTFADKMIWSHIRHYKRSDDEGNLKTTVEMKLIWRKYIYLSSFYNCDEDIAKELNVSLEKLEELKEVMQLSSVGMLEDITIEDKEGRKLSITNSIPDKIELEESCVADFEYEQIISLMKEYFPENHFQVLEMKLEEKSNKATGEVIGCSPQNIVLMMKRIKEGYIAIRKYYDKKISKEDLELNIKKIFYKRPGRKPKYKGGKDMSNNKTILRSNCVDTIVKWAKDNIGETITKEKCFKNSFPSAYSFSDIKAEAIHTLRAIGYKVEQRGVSYRVIEDVLKEKEEVAATVETVTDKPLTTETFVEFMKDLTSVLSLNYDQLNNTMKEVKNINNGVGPSLMFVNNQEITSTDVTRLMNAAHSLVSLAEQNGHKVKATILLEEV